MLTDNSAILNAPAEAIDADQSMVKIFIVVGCGVLLSALTGYLFASGYLLGGLISLLFLSVILVLQNFFVKGFDKLFVAACLESVAGAGFFYADFSGILVITVAALVAILTKSFFDVRRELETSLKVRFWRISRMSLSSSVPALLLFFLVILSVRGSLFTEENFTNFIFRPVVTAFVTPYFPDIKADGSARDFFNWLAVATAQKQLDGLPSSVRNQAIASAAAQYAAGIERGTGSSIDFNKSLSSNFYSGLTSAYSRLTGNWRIYNILSIVILIYLLFRSIMPILYLPLAFIVFIFYEITLAMGFAMIQLESRSREVIVLK